MESFRSLRERFLGSVHIKADGKEPPLDSEVPATLGGANAEPASMARPARVDLAEILDQAATQSARQLDWRHSTVDLLQVLDADACLAARERLADELGYTGDKGDVASMDVWLRKALLYALAENEGRIPSGMLD